MFAKFKTLKLSTKIPSKSFNQGKVYSFFFSEEKKGKERNEDQYEKICREEKERMNRLGEESKEKFKKQTSFTRASFLLFAGVLNIYLLKKIYAFAVDTSDPYRKND